MIYLFYGQEDYLLKKEIDKILETNQISDLNTTNYDLENSTIEDILEDGETISLFSTKKAIIVDNSYIFTGITNKKNVKMNIDLLEQYIKNPNPNTIIIFIIRDGSLDNRKKIVSLIKKEGIVKEFAKEQNIDNFIKQEFNQYKIDKKEINLLKNRVGDNLNILSKEIAKIKIYKDNDLLITEEDILDLTIKNINTDIFYLIDNIVNNNKEAAIECYLEIIKLGEEPIKVIVMLANQFRLIYQSKSLIKKGYSEKDIASILEVHPYRIKLALEKARYFDELKLLNYIEKLADLDFDIKTGKIDKNIGLELFIIGN